MEYTISPYSGEFASQSSETDYANARLPERIRLARLIFQYSALLNVLFQPIDWRFLGSQHFPHAIAARTTIIAISALGVWAAGAIDTRLRLWLVCAVWACPVIAASAVLVAPPTDVALFITFVLPVIFYLALPVPFRLSVTLGAACSVATLGAHLSSGPLTRISLGLALGVLTMNLVMGLVLGQTNRLHRLEWAANRNLAEQRDMLEVVLQAIPTPLVMLARDDGRLIRANGAARAYFGDSAERFPRVADYFDQRDLATLAQRLQAGSSRGSGGEIETRLHFPNGSIRSVLLAATPLTVAGVDAILAILVDITERKEMEALLQRLANTDGLTGLPNRTRFFTVAAVEIDRSRRYGRPLAVCMIDVDLFKRLNDTHGHDAGDAALKALADVFRAWTRQQDIVARLGGEEFGVLLPETDARRALALAERLRYAVEDLRGAGVPARLTISVGVAQCRPGEGSVDAALSRADAALYEAKRSGRNRTVLYDACV